MVEMGLSGWLGRRFGQDAVARVRNTQWGWLGLVWVWVGGRWCAVFALCCLSDVVGTKTRAGGRVRGGMEKGGQRNRMPGVKRERLTWLERNSREKREGQRLADWLSVGNKCKSVEVLVGNSGSGRKRMWCLS